MEAPSPDDPTADLRQRPSKTNPQCKVCTSPDRVEIEVALARGQSQESVATRFSRNGQTFSRQNINVHYHRHMQVLERAVAEEAARRGLNPMLEIERAAEIHAEQERDRVRLRAQVSEQIEQGLPWKLRDILAFREHDVRLEEQRNELRAEAVMILARAYGKAVRTVVADDDIHRQILAAYDEILARRTDTVEDFIFHDDAQA